jgi:serine/threonine protein kinase
MRNERAPGEHAFCLPPGTKVGDWRVLGCRGHGAYGVVYLAVREGQEDAGPVALKLALYPWDPRFIREVALLSLIQHPGVPRLLSHGFWKHPAGTTHPYIVMEWVEGSPLYDWAREHNPSSQQVLQVLAQLARVLQATHAASAVHRDFKGDNILVRRSDGRAMLMDFGAGHYQSAARLTWQSPPPGTPAYRSPEAGLFWIRSVREPNAWYQAGPADDVFALGVTAYRLVTGEYPPCAEPYEDKAGTWNMVAPRLRSPRELNPRVDPRLSALIVRMLSLAPEARGTAGELAEALEAAAGRAGAEAAQPLSEVKPPRTPVKARSRALAWVPAGAMALLGALLLLGTWKAAQLRPNSALTLATGATGMGDAAPSPSPAPTQEQSQRKEIAQEPPPKPFQGQRRPDARGQCPSPRHVSINGGCWVEQIAMDAKECARSGYVILKGRCYAPALDPDSKPVPTSSPADVQRIPTP